MPRITTKIDKNISLTNRHISQTYDRQPITLVKGLGINVWDTNDKQYLDFVSGIAVNNLGHCHPVIVDAIKKQSSTLIHVSNLFYTVPQAELARILTSRSFADKVFFCNSGAEANEAAIKLARKYSQDVFGKGRYEIITALKSFHGRTMATITATGQEKFHKGFEPLLNGFKYVPFNEINALQKKINEKTCAIMFEPIQGEGGVNIPSQDYLKKVKDLCDKHNLLLIFDEVQTGMGRTGKLFAYEHFNIKPDIMTLAKGLGGGIPMGAMLTRDEISLAFSYGTHASTFGGNPLAATAAIATLKETNRGILSNCTKMGDYLLRKLKKIKDKNNIIKDIRGLGLMVAIEMKCDVTEIKDKLLDKGIMINTISDKTIRILPPLIVEKKDIDTLLTEFQTIISEMNNG